MYKKQARSKTSATTNRNGRDTRQIWTKIVSHYWFSSNIWADAVILEDQNEDGKTNAIFRIKDNSS
jgi:hypothetical protein